MFPDSKFADGFFRNREIEDAGQLVHALYYITLNFTKTSIAAAGLINDSGSRVVGPGAKNQEED